MVGVPGITLVYVDGVSCWLEWVVTTERIHAILLFIQKDVAHNIAQGGYSKIFLEFSAVFFF